MSEKDSARAQAEARRMAEAAGHERREAADRRTESRLQRYLAAAFYRETEVRTERAEAERGPERPRRKPQQEQPESPQVNRPGR